MSDTQTLVYQLTDNVDKKFKVFMQENYLKPRNLLI